MPIRIETDPDQTLQLQIFQQIRHLIIDGRLAAGMPLPASRVLASDLGVSRNTVVLAYDSLQSEGYVETRQPTGTYVSSDITFDSPSHPMAQTTNGHHPGTEKRRARLVFNGSSHTVVSPHDNPLAYDFGIGRPDARLFPAKAWQRLVNRTLPRLRTDITPYDEPAGLWALRQAVVEHAGATRGVKARASQALIVNGIQEGLSILARLFVQSGTPVAVENPCYRGAANLFASHGAGLLPVPVDEDGIDVDRLPREAALVYLTPSHQYPTGVTLSLERRTRLIEWAEHHNAYLVEDDSNGDFCYQGTPLQALQGLDRHDQVIYLGTFSKSLAPGSSLAYMILPPQLVAVATTAKALLNDGVARLPQALLAEFLASAQFMRHLRRTRTHYRARRDRLRGELQRHFSDVSVSLGGGGACTLPGSFPKTARRSLNLRAAAALKASACTGSRQRTPRLPPTRSRATRAPCCWVLPRLMRPK